jgi:hypothetical protein
LEIKSYRDPELFFRRITHGRMKIDEDPLGEFVAGCIFGVVGIFTGLIAAYRIYRHCVKYTLRHYFQSKAARKWEEENEKLTKEQNRSPVREDDDEP